MCGVQCKSDSFIGINLRIVFWHWNGREPAARKFELFYRYRMFWKAAPFNSLILFSVTTGRNHRTEEVATLLLQQLLLYHLFYLCQTLRKKTVPPARLVISRPVLILLSHLECCWWTSVLVMPSSCWSRNAMYSVFVFLINCVLRPPCLRLRSPTTAAVLARKSGASVLRQGGAKQTVLGCRSELSAFASEWTSNRGEQIVVTRPTSHPSELPIKAHWVLVIPLVGVEKIFSMGRRGGGNSGEIPFYQTRN